MFVSMYHWTPQQDPAQSWMRDSFIFCVLTSYIWTLLHHNLIITQQRAWLPFKGTIISKIKTYDQRKAEKIFYLCILYYFNTFNQCLSNCQQSSYNFSCVGLVLGRFDCTLYCQIEGDDATATFASSLGISSSNLGDDSTA